MTWAKAGTSVDCKLRSHNGKLELLIDMNSAETATEFIARVTAAGEPIVMDLQVYDGAAQTFVTRQTHRLSGRARSPRRIGQALLLVLLVAALGFGGGYLARGLGARPAATGAAETGASGHAPVLATPHH